MSGYHLHIEGRVQGVGFRPHVFQCAQKFHLSGTVSNEADGVHVHFEAEAEMARQFQEYVEQHAPAQAIITRSTLSETKPKKWSGFQIVESGSSESVRLKISPDFAPCSACKAEIRQKGNRRFGYAFITCTQCGPRYSIMQGLPYDRETTAMQPFEMCVSCAEEFGNPKDRRFFSQTNSCPDCGIRMVLHHPKTVLTDRQEEVIPQLLSFLAEGKIAAVKGVGGYLLLCDATNAEAIRELRKRKNRPEKPFALLYPSLQSLEEDVFISVEEEEALGNEVAPIVLLPLKQSPKNKIETNEIAPHLQKLGVMLPASPLLQLIAVGFGKPLVATSANLSGSPILYQDGEALQELFRFADVLLSYNRKILIPQDDSVVRFAEGQRILLRRSRGLAPAYNGPLPKKMEEGAVALGAEMKGSLAVCQGGEWHISQYLGGLSSFNAQETYRKVLNHLKQMLKCRPTAFVTDWHPNYFTTQLGRELAENDQLPLYQVQHHEAHFAAILQEHDLWKSPEPVLGVIWDGTGFGTDGNSWGGEFFQHRQKEIFRAFHLEYAPQLAYDKMAQQPRLSALSFTRNHPFLQEKLKRSFTENESKLYQKLVQKPSLQTSSIGRLFDAFASLLGLVQTNAYEGQAAILLEECAEGFQGKTGQFYPFYLKKGEVQTDAFWLFVIEDLKAGKSPEKMAFKFHVSLVQLVRQVAEHLGIRQLAFSGGVFQNALLVKLLQEQLARSFSLYFHQELSPNDENIAFGQLAYYHSILTETSTPKQPSHVFSNPRKSTVH